MDNDNFEMLTLLSKSLIEKHQMILSSKSWIPSVIYGLVFVLLSSLCLPSCTSLLCVWTGEMVRQARVLAQATSDLVNAMRSDAEAEVDVDNSKKLLAAAKLLADATARMVEAAKVTVFN